MTEVRGSIAESGSGARVLEIAGRGEIGGRGTLRWAAWLWILSAGLCGFYIWRFGVAVPYWDDFKSYREICGALGHGGWGWGELVSQDNESRPVFPRLIFLSVAKLSHGDERWTMCCTWGLLVSTAVMLHGLANCSLRGWAFAGTAVLSGVGVLRLSQWQNLLWAHQLMLVFPAAALALALYVQNLRWRWGFKILVTCIASFVATFSFANGMVLWVLLSIGMFFAPSREGAEGELKRRSKSAGIVLLIGAISIAFYFHGYVGPEQREALGISDLPALARFASGFLGEGICPWTGKAVAIVMGILGGLIWGICGVLLLRCWIRRASLREISPAMPWLLISGYSLVSAGVTAAGRLRLDTQGFAESRYFTIAIPFWVGLTPVIYLTCRAVSKTPGRLAARAAGSFGVLVFLLIGVDLVRAWGAGGKYEQDRYCEQMICTFSPVVYERDNVEKYVWNHVDRSVTAAILENMSVREVLRFGLERGQFADEYLTAPAARAEGQFEGIMVGANGKVRATGWAVGSDGKKKVDAVLLFAEAPNGRSRLIAMTGETFLPRPDLSTTRHAVSQRGWLVIFDAGDVAMELARGTVMRAYVYDARLRSVEAIAGTVRMP